MKRISVQTTLHWILAGALAWAFAPDAGVAGQAAAQARSTANRTADLSVFALGTYAQPDYSTSNDSGLSFGVDYTRFLRLPVNPSLEFRANFVTGQVVNESSYLGGIRVDRHFSKFTPYADILAGEGVIKYNFTSPNAFITQTSSFLISFGGGVQYELVHNFALKADFQAQRWSSSQNTVTGQSGSFSPKLASFGLDYTLPFNDERGPKKEKRRKGQAAADGSSVANPPAPAP